MATFNLVGGLTWASIVSLGKRKIKSYMSHFSSNWFEGFKRIGSCRGIKSQALRCNDMDEAYGDQSMKLGPAGFFYFRLQLRPFPGSCTHRS